MSSEATIKARVPAELKTSFEAAAKANDLTASQVLRHLMKRYVQDNAQGDLFAKPKRAKR